MEQQHPETDGSGTNGDAGSMMKKKSMDDEEKTMDDEKHEPMQPPGKSG